MSEQSNKLLHWAIVAAQAAGISAAEVAVVDNYEDPDLPAVEIGDSRVWQARTSSDGDNLDGYGWKCTDWGDYYDALLEAFQGAIADEVARRMEAALRDAGYIEEVQP